MASKKQFVHLHNHSDFSLLDGAAKVKDMVAFAAEDGNPAIGLTDHGTMAGSIQLVQAAKKAGIIGIPGLEAYHVPDVSKAAELRKADGKSRFHLTLLAVTTEGYQNLLRLSSIAALDNYYGQPLVDDDLLDRFSEGIVATSGCLGSRFNQALLADDVKLARRILADHRDIFGKDRYFIEVQDHGIPDQKRITPIHLKLAEEMGIPLLAANDSHYMRPEDAHMHDALLCIQTGSQLADEDRFRFSSDQNYMRTADEMWRLFPEEQFPGACENTLRVAEMAQDLHVPIGDNYLIPQFPGAEGKEQDILREMVIAGAKQKYGDQGRYPREVSEQINYELDVIHKMGFDAYFLLVGDVVQWAKRNGIAVGPGRGSAAGSIVSYCLDITTVDPIKYGLYFERFLNPGRKSMPDIDIDFEPSERWRVRQYAASRFGADRVSYIATYGEMKPKAAIKGAARVLGYPASRSNQMSAMVPPQTANGQISLNQIFGPRGDVPDNFKSSWEDGETLRRAYKDNEDVREVVDLAIQIEGYYQQKGVHAAAVLITPGPLTDYVPLHKPKDEGDLPVCSYDKDDAEAIGGLKMDFLGLINLSIIKEAVRLIKDDLGKSVDIDNIPLDDPKVYEMLSKGDTDGVFQLEGEGMRRLLRRMEPSRFDDIAAVLALYRPGPMGTDMHNDYADRRAGRAKPTAEHPDMLEMFADTAGLMIYQEQLIQLSQHFAGFTPAEADTLRKATGKKDAVMIAGQEQKFKRGMIEKGYSKELADKLWAKIPPFAAYSFNKAHAVAYGMISYQTAWLKANYPAQYIAACIDFLDGSRVPTQVQAAKSRGISVHLPDINKSGIGAATSRDSIWLGLSGISNCGDSTITPILTERRRNGEFKSLADFLVRMAQAEKVPNKKSLQSLIKAGVFDSLHGSRKRMIECAEDMIAAAKVEAGFGEDDGEDDLFGDLDDSVARAVDTFDLEGEDYSLSERISMEVEALGFFAGIHPFTMVKNSLSQIREDGLIPADALPVGSRSLKEGRKGTVFGTLSNMERKTTNGKTRITYTLENDEGQSMDCVVFRDVTSSRARIGALVVARGQIRVDTYRDDVDEDGNPPLGMVIDTVEFVPLSMFADDSRDGEAGKGRTFVIKSRDSDEDALQKLAAALLQGGSGPDKLAVIFRGERIVVPTRLKLNGNPVMDRLDEYGASLVEVE